MKKFIVPIIITILMIAYFVFYFGIIIFAVNNLIATVFLGVFPLIFTAIMIYVLIERIKEIRSGEEDDISKY